MQRVLPSVTVNHVCRASSVMPHEDHQCAMHAHNRGLALMTQKQCLFQKQEQDSKVDCRQNVTPNTAVHNEHYSPSFSTASANSWLSFLKRSVKESVHTRKWPQGHMQLHRKACMRSSQRSRCSGTILCINSLEAPCRTKGSRRGKSPFSSLTPGGTKRVSRVKIHDWQQQRT